MCVRKISDETNKSHVDCIFSYDHLCSPLCSHSFPFPFNLLYPAALSSSILLWSLQLWIKYVYLFIIHKIGSSTYRLFSLTGFFHSHYRFLDRIFKKRAKQKNLCSKVFEHSCIKIPFFLGLQKFHKSNISWSEFCKNPKWMNEFLATTTKRSSECVHLPFFYLSLGAVFSFIWK